MSQLDLFTPALTDGELPPVALTPEIESLLAKNAPVAIGVSGGKDSGAAVWAVVNHLNQIGHTGPRLLIHADLGRIEWADSLPICQQLADLFGLELVVVRRPAGGMVERWMSRWDGNCTRYADLACVKLIMPWSSPANRFCTSELKTAIISRELTRRFPGQRIVSVSGIRRQESSKRAQKPICSEQARLTVKTLGTSGVDWNAIIEWKLDHVWNCHKWHNLPIHEAYSTYNMTRVSCCFCIMSSLPDLLRSAGCEANQDVYRELVDLEIASTYAFHEDTWLGDVAPHLLTDEQRTALSGAKYAARRRELAESRIPEHLLFTEGWPTRMPTYDEAVLLAEVRQEVADTVGLTIGFTDPASILQRYAELMAERAEKQFLADWTEAKRELKALNKRLKEAYEEANQTV
ncbi:hypothetical protein FAES_3276 [Fibrella aestuarina BUZ 2]|uniref:Phosphoadenosine phosphosulphate reductase domain-containing protein n=1 Tax=Fibrella aestuarina BUZ 2 TaxID=1166018 RepID=I0KAY2_9BACT|nr:phosphoadenosine phosphosulfate reductase family protein [Fibrella aestuarina]CCH01285.1 hypothetical protein FAES_3276 [Fibrella aestuarina BUZ 2]